MRVRTTNEWVDQGPGRGRHTYHPLDESEPFGSPLRRLARKIDRELALGRPLEIPSYAPDRIFAKATMRLDFLTKPNAKLHVVQKLTPGVRQPRSSRPSRHGG